jgi:hypothetical protein
MPLRLSAACLPTCRTELARALLQLAGEDQPVPELTEDERADLVEVEEEVRRGDFATDEELRALWTFAVWDSEADRKAYARLTEESQ